MSNLDEITTTALDDFEAMAPSVAAQEEEVTKLAEKRETAGKYVVFKEIGESGSWMVVHDGVECKDQRSAILAVAITDEEVIQGRYFATPLASFKPRVIRQVVQVTLD